MSTTDQLRRTENPMNDLFEAEQTIVITADLLYELICSANSYAEDRRFEIRDLERQLGQVATQSKREDIEDRIKLARELNDRSMTAARRAESFMEDAGL